MKWLLQLYFAYAAHFISFQWQKRKGVFWKRDLARRWTLNNYCVLYFLARGIPKRQKHSFISLFSFTDCEIEKPPFTLNRIAFWALLSCLYFNSTPTVVNIKEFQQKKIGGYSLVTGFMYGNQLLRYQRITGLAIMCQTGAIMGRASPSIS